MDAGTLIAVLALGTLAAVVGFAIMSKAKTEDRRDSDAPKSTLASDAPNQR